jgi:hypothetical protein
MATKVIVDNAATGNGSSVPATPKTATVGTSSGSIRHMFKEGVKATGKVSYTRKVEEGTASVKALECEVHPFSDAEYADFLRGYKGGNIAFRVSSKTKDGATIANVKEFTGKELAQLLFSGEDD